MARPPATPARAQQHGGLRFCRTPRQPEQNSTAGFVFTERARRQPEGTTARRRALLHGATSTTRAQQHGGVRFCRAAMAPRQQPLLAQQHGGMCFCRSGHDSQGTAARRRALLLGTTLARATQHGRVCFHRARRQAQVPCFLNSRGDLGSANAALRLSVSVVAAALWWLKRQAWKEVFVSAALPRCAALRPGRVRGPSRAPSGAAGLLGCTRGAVSTAAPRGEILGFGGSGALPGGPNWGRHSCAARLRGPGAASNLKRHARFNFVLWRRWWKVCAAGEKNPGARGHHQRGTSKYIALYHTRM